MLRFLTLSIVLTHCLSLTPPLRYTPPSEPPKKEQLPSSSSNTTVQEKFFTQTLDHTDAGSRATYEQRYFLRDDYVTGGEPDYVFLCTGGEGEIDSVLV